MPGWLSKTWCIVRENTTLKMTANLSKCGAPGRTQRPEGTGKFGDVQIVGNATTRMRYLLTLCRSTSLRVVWFANPVRQGAMAIGPDPKAGFLALNRFGYGARGSTSDLARAASDPRRGQLAEGRLR